MTRYPPSPEQTDAKRHYQSTEQRQSATVEAVIELCAEHEPSTLTTARIANEVGLSQGALFKHFPSKGRLWESVALWVSEQLTHRVFKAADQHSQAIPALEAMFLAHVGFVTHHPGIPRVILGVLQKPGNGSAKKVIQSTLVKYRQKVVELLELGIQQGQVAPHTDTEAAAVLYLGAIQGLVVQGVVSGDIRALEPVAPRIFRLFRAGLQETLDDPKP